MLSNSQPLMDHRSKYERNKLSLFEFNKVPNKSNGLDSDLRKEKIEIEDPSEKEWLEKINNDIDNINKQQSKKNILSFKIQKKELDKMDYKGIYVMIQLIKNQIIQKIK